MPLYRRMAGWRTTEENPNPPTPTPTSCNPKPGLKTIIREASLSGFMYFVERTTSREPWLTGCLSRLHIFIFAEKCPASDCRDSTFKLLPLNLYGLILPCLCFLNLKLGETFWAYSCSPTLSLSLFSECHNPWKASAFHFSVLYHKFTENTIIKGSMLNFSPVFFFF